MNVASPNGCTRSDALTATSNNTTHGKPLVVCVRDVCLCQAAPRIAGGILRDMRTGCRNATAFSLGAKWSRGLWRETTVTTQRLETKLRRLRRVRDELQREGEQVPARLDAKIDEVVALLAVRQGVSSRDFDVGKQQSEPD